MADLLADKVGQMAHALGLDDGCPVEQVADAVKNMAAQYRHVRNVLALLDEFSVQDALVWQIEEDGTIRFSALCNDLFWWASGDDEEVTPGNLDRLRQAFEDCKRTSYGKALAWAPWLFAARVRQLRPQGAAYPDHPALIALFDACGPKREIDIANPYEHPSDGGKYAYKSET